MRIMIVDDNVAIHEVLTSVLNEDNEVETVTTIREAVEKVKRNPPSLVLLDADTEGGDGLKFFHEIEEITFTTKFGVIVLHADAGNLPSDTSYMVDSLFKPFKSEDLLKAIEIFDTTVEPIEPRKPKKETRKERKEPISVTSSAESRLLYGESYVMFSDNPRNIQGAAGAFANEDYNVLLITASRLKIAKEKFKGLKSVEVRALSNRTREGYLDSFRLGSMIEIVNEFISKNERPVVVFDNLNVLMEKRDTNSVLTMMHRIVKTKYDNKIFTILASIDPTDLTDKDKEVLLDCMTNYTPEESK